MSKFVRLSWAGATAPRLACTFIVSGLLFGMASTGLAQESFGELVGPITVQPVAEDKPVTVPFITWGGDVATFMANGGLETTSGSVFDRLGVKIKLTNGDDFPQQVKDYLSGKTPFLRGTMRMLGQASEVLGKDPRTKPVVFLQLSWSAGDHIVARQSLKTLNDLRSENGKKARIACQKGGPHVGLLYDSLDAAKISRDEIEIVWVDDLTGENGPAEAFRKDSSIDACCVITPDMIGLTGGYDSTGSGAEGTVEGARVLNSTRDMSRSIADVYAVRSDWLEGNREFVANFVAGYLASTEKLVAMRRTFEESQTLNSDYQQVLTMAQEILGKDVLPTLEVDGHGLLLDCGFVGLPGQIAFFEDAGNLSGFDKKMKAALDLATGWGYASFRSGFEPPSLDYRAIASSAGIEYKAPTTDSGSGVEIGEGGLFPGQDLLDDKTIVSFTIKFDPNKPDFSPDRYGPEFNRAIQAASTFGNAAIEIRGHADPTKALIDMIKGGMKKGIITRTGNAGNFEYFVSGKPLDLTQTETIIKFIETGGFDFQEHQPSKTVKSALSLSLSRAEAVKRELINFAKAQQVNLNEKQLQPTGAGIAEPIIPKPANFAEATRNMRVEFRVIRVPAETIKETDFAF